MKGNKILKLISAFILGIVVLSGTAITPVHAEEEQTKPAVWLQVSPTNRAVALNPGDEIDGEFTVTNIGSEEFVFKVYASPFSVVGEEYDHDYISEKSYNQIHRWVTFPEGNEFTLPAGSGDNTKKVVKYHISVPEDVPAGSQHAVLFAESSGNTTTPSGDGIKAISRVGMRLSANIAGETNMQAEITDYSLPTTYISFEGLKLTATSKVKNSGNTDFQAKYHYEVKPFFGGDPVYTDDKTALIYPESEFRQEILWENTPLLGLFNVNYSVLANGVTMDETRIVLVMPAWLLIIMLILLTFLIVWITLVIKKRRMLRSKAAL